MALFGDLGKALGLGSGKDILPLLGSAAGFYFGGPMGASLGGGLGSLAAGKSVNDALSNAALAYGVSSFVSPKFMSTGVQGRTGLFGQSGIQQSLYGQPAKVVSSGIQPAKVAGALQEGQEVAAKSTADGGGIFGLFEDGIGAKEIGLGTLALGALSGGPEVEGGTSRPFAGGEAWEVVYKGEVYDLGDPDEREAYKEAKREDSYSGFRYAKDGGMGYDVPVRGEVSGPGTGTSDSVPARLSDGEFVLTAQAVRGAGGGDRDVGAARLYDMMAELEATA